MVETLTIVYLGYMFSVVYLLTLFVLVYLQNKKEIHFIPQNDYKPSVSVLIPAYNEEASIKLTVENIVNSDYENLIEIIIINDGSTDKTKEISLELEKKYSKVILLDKKNSGKADSLNVAIKLSKGELFAVVDADSFPDTKAISEMVGFFVDKSVGSVTPRILVRDKNNFIQKLQGIEYKVIAFTRKLLDFLDSIYVTPGPLALYRKSIIEDLKGFDKNNITEDIELTWHLLSKGYKVRMSFPSFVTSIAPDTFRDWFKQRIRWNLGGFQTMVKYKGHFFKKGMLGYFVLPFFTVSLLLGVVGLGIFFYRVSIRFVISYLSTKQSLASEVAIISLSDINLYPSILHFFGVLVFILGFMFIIFSIKMIAEDKRREENIITMIFYLLIYSTLYPLVLIISLHKFLKRDISW